MSPFLGYEGGKVLYQLFFCGIALYKGYAAGGGFLFAPCVVGQDVFQGNAGEVHPARIGWQLEAQDILLFGSRFHPANLHISGQPAIRLPSADQPANCLLPAGQSPDFCRFVKNLPMPDEGFLDKKLDERRGQNAFRRLRLPDGKTDFCSNDYLGIATNGLIGAAGGASGEQGLRHGSGGSRLLAGNYPLIEETDRDLAVFHQAEAALIFNSGYDANLGVLSSVPQRGDTVFYDALSHASIRDGLRLSLADSFSFRHNDTADLERKLQSLANGDGTATGPGTGTVFVVTESVFSMDGDQAPLEEILGLCRQYGAQLIIDEAHATGVVGPGGAGLVQEKGLAKEFFARIHTFGKAVGCHGAVVLGSQRLRDYLINFCRPFIYTTALPATSMEAIRVAYELFPGLEEERQHLQRLIGRFQQASIRYQRLSSGTPIQVVIVPGNDAVKKLAEQIQSAGLDVRPILYPTVPRGGERLRIVLHSFNTIGELDRLVGQLA